jgi:lipoprotein-anchoring transpeptidase ErfK/SrfK
MKFITKLIAAVSLALLPTAAFAADITSTHIAEITTKSIVKPGDYVWSDVEYFPGTVVIKVNLKTQMLYVMRGNMLVGATNISSGREGFETPTGKFSILGKEDNHFSKKYKADMPYTMWVNNDGVALHSGGTPGRPSSHGCIHLPNAFAANLYQIVDKGATVVITDERPTTSLNLNLN